MKIKQNARETFADCCRRHRRNVAKGFLELNEDDAKTQRFLSVCVSGAYWTIAMMTVLT